MRFEGHRCHMLVVDVRIDGVYTCTAHDPHM